MPWSLAAACLLAIALAGCVLPGGGASGERQLQREVARMESAPQQEQCPVTQTNLSVRRVENSAHYLCSSPERLRALNGHPAPTDAVVPETVLLQTADAERFEMADEIALEVAEAPEVADTLFLASPCPPDRFLYLVEQGDDLQQLARIASVGGNWRSWAGATRLRNPQCFNAAGDLKTGCELRIPAVDRSRLAGEFDVLWESGGELAPESFLQTCQRQWSQS